MFDTDSDDRVESTSAEMAAADAALTTVTEEEATPEPAAEPAAEPGQPRDEQGRFTETPKGEPEPVVETDPAPPPEQPGEPATEPAEGVEPPTDDSPDEPFSYRADNQDFAIPGSAVGDDGIFIPKEQLPEVQNLLSAGKAAFGSVRQRLSDAAAREQTALDRATAAEAQAQHVLAHFEELIESGRAADWLTNVQQNWPILKAEAKAKGIELQHQATAKELERYRETENQARLRPLMEQTLQQSIRTQGSQLDESTQQAVLKLLKDPQYEKLLFVKAPYDDPGSGIRKGELVIDNGVVASAIQLASIHRPQQVQQQKIVAAQAANAKLAPPKRAVVPPTVAGKGRAPKQSAPVFKTAKEADDFLLNGELDSLVAD